MEPYAVAEEEAALQAGAGTSGSPPRPLHGGGEQRDKAHQREGEASSPATKPMRPTSAVRREGGSPAGKAGKQRGSGNKGSPSLRFSAKSALKMAVEQMSRFMLSNKILLRRTLSTGSFSSLHAKGSVGQFVYYDTEQGWVSGVHQSPESAVIGALLGLGGHATEKAHFSLRVGDLAKRTRALMKSSEHKR